MELIETHNILLLSSSFFWHVQATHEAVIRTNTTKVTYFSKGETHVICMCLVSIETSKTHNTFSYVLHTHTHIEEDLSFHFKEKKKTLYHIFSLERPTIPMTVDSLQLLLNKIPV